jgi:nucleoside-diphosphate-sugar epimerase
MGCSLRLFPFPVKALWAMAGLLGKKDEMRRLIGDLTVDANAFYNEFKWVPPYNLNQGIDATVQWYQTIQQEGRP